MKVYAEGIPALPLKILDLATEINAFVSRLAVKEKAAASSQNQALAALLFLYKNILGLTIKTPENIVRAKKPKKLPAVMTREETAKIFSLLPENDYGLLIRLLYGTGMRLMEALRLRIQDIDFGKNEITVHCGKGAKDRSPFSEDRPNLPAVHLSDLYFMVERCDFLFYSSLDCKLLVFMI